MNPLSLPEQKSALRTRIRAAVHQLTADERATSSAKILASLRAQAVWKNARTVLLFSPLHDEADLWPAVVDAVAAGKTIALPRFVADRRCYEAALIRDLARDCATGSFGIREPRPECAALPLNQLDFVLVPGIGFDSAGWRLGRGKGYYDQLLATVTGIKCGVGFDCQLVDAVPHETHDVRLNCLLTPSRWFDFDHTRGD